MRAIVTGFVLDIQDRTFGSGNDARTVKNLRVQTGKAQIDTVRLDPSRFRGDLPREGEHVALAVWFSAYVGRNGAQVSCTAQEHVDLASLDAVPAAV